MDVYQTPFNARYASDEMIGLFSARTRYSTWRKLWLWLAEAQAELGLSIPELGLAQMKAHVNIQDEEFAVAAAEEKKCRHDVMAHIHAFAKVAPAAAGIIHWGATSCYCTDNADLIILRDGFNILLPKLARVIFQLAKFARQYKSLACLAYTHGQPAQLTTMGKRACLWIQDLLMDLRTFERAQSDIKFRGVKGTTGTQASFLQIFGKQHDKVKQLDALVTQKAGFKNSYTVTSQTYSRKVDADILNALASFGATCERFGGDIRHLAMFKELEEPFESDQVGSSAMAYKRNPMRSERLCSLGRYLKNLAINAMDTYGAQWLERSLDDSAIRRITLPQAYLCADSCLRLLINVTNGLVVYPRVIEKRLQLELPFMATENIIMACVNRGLSRQEAHEAVRQISLETAEEIKLKGSKNTLIDRVKVKSFFKPILPDLQDVLDTSTFIGRAPQQVEDFLGKMDGSSTGEVSEALAAYRKYTDDTRLDVDLNV